MRHHSFHMVQQVISQSVLRHTLSSRLDVGGLVILLIFYLIVYLDRFSTVTAIDANQTSLVHWHSKVIWSTDSPIPQNWQSTIIHLPFQCRFWRMVSAFKRRCHIIVLIFRMYLECQTCFHSFRWLGLAIRPLFVVLGITISRSLSYTTLVLDSLEIVRSDELVSVLVRPNWNLGYAEQFISSNGLMYQIYLPSNSIPMDQWGQFDIR